MVEDEDTGVEHLVERILPVTQYTIGQRVGYRIDKANGEIITGEGMIQEFNISCFVTDVDEDECLEYDWNIWYILSEGVTVHEHEIKFFYEDDEDETEEVEEVEIVLGPEE